MNNCIHDCHGFVTRSSDETCHERHANVTLRPLGDGLSFAPCDVDFLSRFLLACSQLPLR